MRWALRSARFPANKNTDRPLSYPSEDGLNFDGIDAPTLINQIKRVEKQNKMELNVFGYENKAIVPYQLSDQPASIARINL